MRNFALIGAAGYIAPRHIAAIKETGNNLLACLDPNDSVGIIDNYFPNSDFFTEFERFDRHIDKLRRLEENKIDYISICSPNYLHDAHIRFALRSEANAICEKPIVLNTRNLDALIDLQKEYGKEIKNILQLRYHPSIKALHKSLKDSNKTKKSDIQLTYITSRGNWYLRSWKGNVEKSGGIASNIGVHFFDMLYFLFGEFQDIQIHAMSDFFVSGYLELSDARVSWFLSIDSNDLPDEAKENMQTTFRSIKIDNEEIEFSSGFTDLHIACYQDILNGGGYGLSDARPSIEIVEMIRDKKQKLTSDIHPILKRRINEKR